MKAHWRRRTFLKKIITGSAGLYLLANKSFSVNNISTMQPIVLKNIRKLGFQWQTANPFLFCVHHLDYYPAGTETMAPQALLKGRSLGNDFDLNNRWRMYHGTHVPGFPVHPHRGFETVTIVTQGYVDHFDSLGGAGRYGRGDVQWMTAGKGVQHAEMFPLVHMDKENTTELFQIWLNLPKADKMVQPEYKMLWNTDIPLFTHTNVHSKIATVKVIAGNFADKTALPPPQNSWAANTNNHLAIWLIDMEPEATLNLPAVPTGVNRTLYFFEGQQLQVNSETVKANYCADVAEGIDLQLINGPLAARILVLQGKPINEPVVQYGPFVMNTYQEIEQAYADYQQTRFGGWPWPVPDPVHPRNKGTFAGFSGNE